MNWILRKEILPPRHHDVLICDMNYQSASKEFPITIAFINGDYKAIFTDQYTHEFGVHQTNKDWTHWCALYDIPKPNQPERSKREDHE